MKVDFAVSDATIIEELKQHQMRVSNICEKIGRALDIPYSSLLELLLAAQLHDVGKLWIPQNILIKPSKLNEEEMEIMKQHVFFGYEYVRNRKMGEDIATAVLYHHERFDGQGYIGLKDREIPLFSRIIAVADAFDTMTSDRPYKNTLSIKEAVEEIERNAGTQFDPEIAEIFIKLGVYKVNK